VHARVAESESVEAAKNGPAESGAGIGESYELVELRGYTAAAAAHSL
jgi:hypothetical protein